MSMKRMETLLYDGFQREAKLILESKITRPEVQEMMDMKFGQEAGLMLEESVVDQQVTLEGIEHQLNELRDEV